MTRVQNVTTLSTVSAVVLTMGLASTAEACSQTTDCEVALGQYNIALPEGVEGPIPAVVFVHGFGGSGKGVFNNKSLTRSILDRGYALIAPSGLKAEGRNGGSWSFHPDWEPRRDEIAFLTSVRDQAIAEHNVDPDRIVLSGFSIGGSMTSYLACQEPDAFSAYAPLGGSFWRAHPEGCAGPVRLLHTHGWTDGTVPLEGRILRNNQLTGETVAQGDVFHAMTIWRETNDCVNMKADRFVTEGAFWHRAWDRCAPGSALEFALHPRGHIVPQAWAPMMLDWYEAL